MNPEPNYRVCDQCGVWVEGNELLYRLRVELCAEPGPVELGSPEQVGDAADELEKLMHRLESMTAEEVSEATAQVYEAFDFALCANCRQGIRAQLRNRLTLFDAPPRDKDAPF